MAYEWLGGVVVGSVGIIFTWLTGKQARDQVERMATERFGHERTMAHEAREQERLADAYVRLLVLVERIGQWAQMVKPMFDTVPPQEVRPLPELDEQAEAEAVVNAFGSDQARQAFEAWRGIVRDIIEAARLIDHEQELRTRGRDVDLGQPWETLLKLRPEEREARMALTRQVSSELRGSQRAV